MILVIIGMYIIITKLKKIIIIYLEHVIELACFNDLFVNIKIIHLYSFEVV